MNDTLRTLSEAGVSIWLDDLSRERLVSGSLADLAARDHVVGVTTNPSIFAKAITGSDAYDPQLRDLATRGVEVREALRALTTFDVRWACDVLRPAYDATQGVDGRVSIEVDARLAHDTEATIAEARALWWLVNRPNLFIKIPAARQGLPAIAGCLAEGISINVTLIFSLQRYDEVMGAFLDGMERASQAGHDLSSIGSVASFFVSRVDTEIDSRLNKIGTSEAAGLRGRAAIANARLAYQHYEQVFSAPRWTALSAAGAGRSGRCGPRRRSRIRRIQTPAMWSTWSLRAWSTPCPRPPCAWSTSTVRCPPTRYTVTTTSRSMCWTSCSGSASTTTRSRRNSKTTA